MCKLCGCLSETLLSILLHLHPEEELLGEGQFCLPSEEMRAAFPQQLRHPAAAQRGTRVAESLP